jgi:dihydroorotase
VSSIGTAWAQTDYDLIIKSGHVIDGKNRISAVRDVAIKDGKIAAVAANIAASRALKTVDASGLYVTPGLVDIHVHVYRGLVKNSYAAGSWGLQPDGFTLRVGVTTVADAGSAGWRNFEDFKTRIIDTQKTRVLSFLNIVGAGMGSGPIEQNLADMEVKPAADTALKYKGHHRRNQERALQRPGMDSLHQRRGGGKDRPYSSDGGLRRQRPRRAASV